MERPDHPAVIAYEGGKLAHEISYAQLAVLVERFAGALAGLGVGRGDAVVIYVPNWWLLAPLYLGCARAGAIAVPAQAEYRGREVGHILRASGAKVCVSADVFDGLDFAGRVAGLAPPALQHRVVVGGDAARTGALDFTSLFVETAWERDRQVPGPGLGADDPALIIFTSGTTGEPKAVMHSLNTIWAAANSLSAPYGLTGRDVITIPQQLTHVAGAMHAVYAPVGLGATCLMHDTKADVNLLLEMIQKHRVTWLHASPSRLSDLLSAQRATPRDTSSIRVVSSSSAPIPERMVDDMRDVFGVELMACWGMTETGGCTTTTPDDPPGWAAHSDGRTMPWMETRIGQPGEAGGGIEGEFGGGIEGGIGRLFVRGASLCLGYSGQPELYAASLDGDGWFDTGDMARPDGRGGIRITGRRADLITRPTGEKVPTLEIEAVLTAYPAISEAVLVGYPDPELPDGDALCAVVVAPGEALTRDEINQYLDSSEVTPDHWPDRVVQLDALPKNDLGKVLRNELRAVIQEGRL
ncbi:MAG TPA: AMP-binding protein [Streptosporangiaceae bacterium]|nr:AMP-binding protein [Streptosporangiaceae bacterium]